MDPVSPVKLLTKLPVPVPFTVLVLNATVAVPELVLQHTPLAVTGEPPSTLILPPDAALVGVMAEMAAVVRVGITMIT